MWPSRARREPRSVGDGIVMIEDMRIHVGCTEIHRAFEAMRLRATQIPSERHINLGVRPTNESSRGEG
ncbi:hypothetical protein ABH922_005371 [Rhodococcus sp. 27YEA15]